MANFSRGRHIGSRHAAARHCEASPPELPARDQLAPIESQSVAHTTAAGRNASKAQSDYGSLDTRLLSLVRLLARQVVEELYRKDDPPGPAVKTLKLPEPSALPAPPTELP